MIIRLVVFLWLCFLPILSHTTDHSSYLRLADNDDELFVKSFLKYFEFSPEGRYVHEYHSFILQKTSESFRILEQAMTTEGFNLHGRYAILGYEENSMPQYYTDFKAAKINDEATTKNNAGWSQKLHNRFGFMSGFTLKDVNKAQQKEHLIFEHINAQLIPLFDTRADIFHEHAFGEALPLIKATHNAIVKTLQANNPRGVLKILVNFWEKLYSSALKVGNKEVAGTQDILFSVEGAKHLLASPVPLKKYFTGPDLTYPIEVFNKQHKDATKHAQTFVKRFSEMLIPQDDENTVYVFCSFVDGVGKSTMLGNVKNWMNYGNNVEQYQHVDNSSSQLADMFQFSDKVFIADLPAQMSHFTYKPDGIVFVDITTEKKYAAEITNIHKTIAQKSPDFEKAYANNLIKVKQIIAEKGFFDESFFNVLDPEKAYLRNLILLKKEANNYWIPFTYNGSCFLFNRDNKTEIRCLQTLAEVKSEGLKNIKSEQMLFFSGIRFPLPYDVFMQDLLNKFKQNNIKNVVFVDFLSMYPRSSRENIRVNYLLQQMALVDDSFDVHKSIYHDFINGGELLYAMQSSKTVKLLAQSLELETLLRFFLLKMIIDRKEGDLTGIDVKNLTSLLKKNLSNNTASLNSMLQQQVAEKVKKELNQLERSFGISKPYVNIQQLSLNRVCVLSSLLEHFFRTQINHNRFNYLWRDPGLPLENLDQGESKDSFGSQDSYGESSNGSLLYTCFMSNEECKDELILCPMLRFIRASWYASLSNLLFTVPHEEHRLLLPQEIFKVPACFVKKGPKNTIHVLQHAFESWHEQIPQHNNVFDDASLFNLPGHSSYGLCNEEIYRLDWDSKGTDTGVYCYDFVSEEKCKTAYADPSNTSRVITQYQAEVGVGNAMPSVNLCSALERNRSWDSQQAKLTQDAEKNGALPFVNGEFTFKGKEKAGSQKTKKVQKSNAVFLGNALQREGARLFVRIAATIEMIIKDTNTNAVVRFNNREDFCATIKMVESMTLPRYYHILFNPFLFEDYEKVEPFPSWDFWEKVQS